MENLAVPHFRIKNRFQKGGQTYRALLTDETLEDVCERVTGLTDFTYEFDDTDYNIGRLATLEYNGTITYISFSVTDYSSRNSSFQSFPSALVRYIQDESENKRICFYFLPSRGNYETNYFIFMYRLMKTAGTEFLNEEEYLTVAAPPFNSVEDIIVHRDANREGRANNNSSYLTRNSENILQIYGKTYGANKYESALLCIAISQITTTPVELYQISEGGLNELPRLVLDAIITLGKIAIIRTDLTLEQAEFERNDSLRSPTYIFNLFEKLGPKKCSFCDCEIPQLIQGAHIWPVASIKRANDLTFEQKLAHAIDGENGMWLCENHHKLLDVNILIVNGDGELKYRSNLEEDSIQYIKNTTPVSQIDGGIFTPEFFQYLVKRNQIIEEARYTYLTEEAI